MTRAVSGRSTGSQQTGEGETEDGMSWVEAPRHQQNNRRWHNQALSKCCPYHKEKTAELPEGKHLFLYGEGGRRGEPHRDKTYRGHVRERLAGVHSAQGLSSAPCRHTVVVHTYNPESRRWKHEDRGSPQLPSEFKTSMGFIRYCLKTK